MLKLFMPFLKASFYGVVKFIDVADAVSQDAVADSLIAPLEETTDAAANPAEESVVADGEDTSVEQPEAETQETTEEAADDWLPTEQEKVFPPEVLERYAPRYGFTAEELQGDPRIARIVQDKLNSDIYINQLRQREEQADLVAETKPLEPTQQQQPQQQVTVEQHIQNIRKMVEGRTDPVVAKDFFTGFNKIFCVSDEQIAATLKSNPNAATDFTNLMSTYALNLFNTFVPDLIWNNLAPALEQV